MARFNNEAWDAIVIGSGIGGLTSASLLARAGRRVLVLERHSVAGGFTHTFTRKGFEWDVGVHYVGQVHDTTSPMRRLFDYVSDGELDWAPMDATYDRAVFGEDVYDFVSGKENLIQSLLGHFPTEELAIREYFRLVLSVSTGSAWFFGEKCMPPWLSATLGRVLRGPFSKASRRTTYDVLRELTANEHLIAVLCAQCGDYGLAPRKSSFGMHAVVVEHYLGGGSYPKGGARRIHETLVAGIERRNGTLAVNAEVERILLDSGKVVGVRMADGEDVLCPIVISNAGVLNTFQRLLPPDACPAFAADALLGHVHASTAHICLYVGLEASDAELGLPKHNLWIYDGYDFDAATHASGRDDPSGPPLTYISFPSAKDPEWAAKHPGKATVQVMAGYDNAWTAEWEGTPWMRRGADYVALKERLTTRLLEKLYIAMPQVRGRVKHAELSTPVTTRHFMNNQQGEIYGLEHSPARFALRWLRPKTVIHGLFLTGQDIVTVGVGGALFSGLITAVAVLKLSIVWQFLGRGTAANERPALQAS